MIYYNDCDPFAVAWLKNLVSRGVIAPGDVDERPIQEVKPDDVRGYTQCHFFAGIGGWAEALRLAGWGDRPVWTGSCPCQPWSAAGKGEGAADDRHLWPEWFRLIRECRPERVFGEQVAGAIGHGWLDLVSTDLEAEGYAVGACVLGAHSVGAPHIRQRLWFVADTEHAERRAQCLDGEDGRDGADARREEAHGIAGTCGEVCLLADAERDTREPRRVAVESREGAGAASAGAHAELGRCGVSGSMDHPPSARRDSTGSGAEGEARVETWLRGPEPRRATRLMADPSERGLGIAWAASREPGRAARGESDGELEHAVEPGLEGHAGDGAGRLRHEREVSQSDRPVSPAGVSGFWDAVEWLPCRDGKARPVEPGTFPLAHGIPGRVGRLRAYGNAINPYQAAAFIRAYEGLK